MDPRIKDSEKLKTIANTHRKTVPQIILRWDVEREIIPLPKSSSPDRMRQNIDIFDFKLENEEIAVIDSLNENYKFHLESFQCPGY
jgi:diketogulonate reductase-like aldo/keto reductase